MNQFVRKHHDKVNATLGCFDRTLFRGYLPIQSGWAMAQLLNQKAVSFRNLKGFLTEHAAKVKEHAKAMAAKLGRPFLQKSEELTDEDSIRSRSSRSRPITPCGEWRTSS
jgi:hypothetical protein